MTLLAAVTYDPTVAVSKSTATAIAMTALDTTNLRLTFTVPSDGRVQVHMRGTIHGAATFPQILMGVMDGINVRGRVAPKAVMGGTALATTFVDVEALFVVTGLTPSSSLTWDAAYSVETAVASSAIKYGGPNLATANDAFGAFQYEIWSTV